VEAVEIFDLVIIKRDGRRESYQRDKIESGLRRALEKRPYTTDGFRGLVGIIEQDIQRKRQTEIASREMGEIVMKHLRNFDLVGYVRFASVYRSFTDIQSFREEIEKLPSKKN
jgi:transcriptional repressor NrdR